MTDSQHPIRSWLSPVKPLDAERVWEKIERRTQRGAQTSRAKWFFVLGPALALGLAALIWRGAVDTRSSGPLLLASGQAPTVLAAASGAEVIRLSDGSKIELAAHARLNTRQSTGTMFETELASGRAVFDVVPHGPRLWRVRAADLQVDVLGTRFSVERSTAGVRVAVERGTVRVAGPQVAQGTRLLHAGESAYVAQPSATADEQAGPAPSQPSAAVAPTAQEQADPAPSQPALEPAEPESTSKPRPAAKSDIETWLQRADAARAAGQHGKAVAALKHVVDHYSKDSRAALAAFTLAQLYLEQLGKPLLAADAFERAGTLGLPTALADEAAARRVEAYSRAQRPELARQAADAYRTKYPKGARTSAVARWAAEAQ